MEKTEVNGDQAHPVFVYLRCNSELYNPKKKKAKDIPWNFTKFVVDQRGQVRGYFDPRQLSMKALPLIEELLNE